MAELDIRRDENDVIDSIRYGDGEATIHDIAEQYVIVYDFEGGQIDIDVAHIDDLILALRKVQELRGN